MNRQFSIHFAHPQYYRGWRFTLLQLPAPSTSRCRSATACRSLRYRVDEIELVAMEVAA